MAGQGVRWLRDNLGIIDSAAEVEELVRKQSLRKRTIPPVPLELLGALCPLE